jgi:hypothetical protein
MVALAECGFNIVKDAIPNSLRRIVGADSL